MDQDRPKPPRGALLRFSPSMLDACGKRGASFRFPRIVVHAVGLGEHLLQTEGLLRKLGAGPPGVHYEDSVRVLDEFLDIRFEPEHRESLGARALLDGR